jgi:hypothetical protein
MPFKAREHFIGESKEFLCGHATEDNKLVRSEDMTIFASFWIEEINHLDGGIREYVLDTVRDTTDDFFGCPARTEVGEVNFNHDVFSCLSG